MKIKHVATVVSATVLVIGVMASTAQAARTPATRTPTTLIPAAVAPAVITPATDTTIASCGDGTSGNNAYTCVHITGVQGTNYVDTMQASVYIQTSARRLKVCLRGPNASLGCNPNNGYTTVNPGQVLSFWYRPHSDVPSGQFCANVYRDNGDGTNTQIGHQCLSE